MPKHREQRAPAGPARPGPPEPSPPRSLAPIARGFLVPALFLAAAMPWLITAPFHGDDYVFLDRVLRPTFRFADVWSRGTTTFGWYRPWSRELHFWAISRVFGANETVFHAANALLWVLTLGLFALVVRRIAGAASAWFALTGAMAAAIWLVPLFWASGCQDLWMLGFVLAALLAWVHGRPNVAGVLLAPALLSKESALVAPLLFAGYSLILERRHPWRLLRDLLPALVVLAAWLVVHPTILAHLLQRYPPDPAVLAARQSPQRIAGFAFLTPFNVDNPSADFFAAWLHFDAHTIGAAGLLLLAAWCWRSSRGAPVGAPAQAVASPASQIAFGGLWWLLGSLPAFMGSVAWHAYYVSLGVLGAWLALAGLARVRPRLAFVCLVLAICARGPRLATPDWDWGAFPAQERAGRFVRALRTALLEELPRVPANSRLYFTNVPRGIGFVTADGPLFRIVYRDTTLRAGFWAEYRPRAANDAPGTDYFISFSPPSRWNIVRPDGAPPSSGEAVTEWESDHRALALTLGRAGDWAGAESELDVLLAFHPQSAEYRTQRDYCARRLADIKGLRAAPAPAPLR